MPRIELKLPEVEIFSSELKVRIGDINFAGHLGHDSILTLFHQIRAEFFHKHNLTEVNVEGKGIVVSDVAIVYKSEAFFSDTLVAYMYVDEIRKKSFDLYYKLIHKESKKEVALAKTGIVFFDYEARTPAPIPNLFLALLNSNSSIK